MQKKKNRILILSVPLEDNNLSIRIRHNNILKYLNTVYEVSHLTIDEKHYPEMNNGLKSCNITHNFKRLLKISEYHSKLLDPFADYVSDFINENQIHTVIILVKPFFLIRLASYLKKRISKIRIILDMSDPCYTMLSRNLFKNIYVKLFERRFIRKVDALTVTNNAIKNYYNSMLENVFVVDQGLNKEMVLLAKKYPIDLKHKCPRQLLIIYGGKFVKRLREPYELFKAITYSPLKLEMKVFGENSAFENQNIKTSMGNSVTFCPPVTQQRLFLQYATCDIIVHMDNFKGFQVPGKTLELLAFDKPILFIYNNDKSDTLMYMKNQPGVFCCKNTAEQICEMLEAITKELPKRYHRHFEVFFWENVLEQFKVIIEG